MDSEKAKINKIEDIEAINKYLSGDESGFVFLEKKYKKIIGALIRKMINNEDDVQDLVQETFIKACNSLNSYNSNFAFSSWIYRIASNHCIDFLRKKRFQTISLTRTSRKDDEDYYLDIKDEDSHPENEYLFDERMKIINKAIDDLPHKYKEIIRLRHEEDMDYNDISIHLGIPIGTVKANLFRARKLLYEKLKSKRYLFYDK